MTETTHHKTLIIGLGNTLLGDEGVGIRVVEDIRKTCQLPDHVQVVDGGTAGYKLLDWIKGKEQVILVDAVRGGEAPGAIYHLGYEDVKKRPDLKLSGHQIDLPEVLALAEKLGELPELLLIGIEPEVIDYGMELSKDVQSSIRPVIENILEVLKGSHLTVRGNSE